MSITRECKNLHFFNPISDNPTKWSNTLTRKLPTNCLSVYDHFVKLTPKELTERSHLRVVFGLLSSCYNVYQILCFFLSGIHVTSSVKYSRVVVNTIKLLYCCSCYEYFLHLKYFADS